MPLHRFGSWLACPLIALALTAHGAGQSSPEQIRSVTARVDGRAIQVNEKSTRNWPSYGLDYGETRFSRLRQIDAGNVGKAGPRLVLQLESQRGVEATPVVVEGIMYA